MPSDRLKNPADPSGPNREAAPSDTSAASSVHTDSHEAQLYVLGEVGHIYAYTVYPANSPAEPMCTILGLSVDRDSMQVEIEGRLYNERALIAAPRTSRMLPCAGRVVAFAFYPPTATHRAMQLLPTPRVKTLRRDDYRKFDDVLNNVAMGAATCKEAQSLFDGVAESVAASLPHPPPLDDRVAAVGHALFVDPTVPVDDLSKSVKLSADRLSHLFTETLGIDLRRYRLWLKLGRAALIFSSQPDLSMGELAHLAGFSDSAHLSRAVKEVYGGAPTRFLSGIKIHAPET